MLERLGNNRSGKEIVPKEAASSFVGIQLCELQEKQVCALMVVPVSVVEQGQMNSPEGGRAEPRLRKGSELGTLV